MKKIVLASESPRRAEILRLAGYDFEIAPSYVDESLSPHTNPADLVSGLSYMKAAKAACEYSDAVIIGADTVVVSEGEIIGKPTDENDAFQILKRLTGKKHTVYTGVTLLRVSMGSLSHNTFFDTADVYMSEASDNEITAYIQTGEPMDKAGAYAAQGKGCVFIDRIDGSFFTVMGLPISKIYRELNNEGD